MYTGWILSYAARSLFPMVLGKFVISVGLAVSLIATACGGSVAVEQPRATATATVSSTGLPTTKPDTNPTLATHSISPTPSPVPSLRGVPSTTASAITFPPNDLTGINEWHAELEKEDSIVRFGTHADAAMITLGPMSGGPPGYDAYSGKTSMNIKMPYETPILAPMDITLIGYANRSAEFRGDDVDRQSPFDDLETCFQSADPDWPGMVFCVYHLSTSPLLPGHNQSSECTSVERWDINGPGQAEGWLYFEDNDAYYEADGSSSDTARNALACRGLIGRTVKRGDVIGYSGIVGDNPHAAFRFKVQHESINPTVQRGDRNLHWVQPAPFFYWKCYEPEASFPDGVLAYPVECGGYKVQPGRRDSNFKYNHK